MDSFSSLDDWVSLVNETENAIQKFENESDPEALMNVHCRLGELDYHYRSTHSFLKTHITNSKKLEDSIRLMGDLFSHAPVGIIILNEDGIIENANFVAAELWKIQSYRLKGLGIHGLITKEHIEIFSNAFRAVKISRIRKSIDIRCSGFLGHYFWGRFDLIRAYDEQTDKQRILCSITDITSDRVLEDAIKKTAIGLTAITGSSFFQQLTDFLTGYPSIEHAIISKVDDNLEFESLAISSKMNIEGPTRYKHQNLESFLKEGRLTHFHNGSLDGRNPLISIFAGNDGISIFLLNSNRKISGELGIFSDGKIENRKLFASILNIVSARASAELQRHTTEEELKEYRDRLEEVVAERTNDLKKKNLLLAQEIDKRKKSEHDLLDAKIQAEQAMQTKSTFLANMSHEIRTPLNGVIGIANLMEQLDLPEKAQDYLEVIKQSGSTLLRIIDDILDISKLESGKIEFEYFDVNLRELLQNVFDFHSPQIKRKRLSFFVEYPLDLPTTIKADRHRLRQVLDNLISNAVKFTEKGQIIVCVSFSANFEQVTICIEDSGIGLTSSHQETIFERFAQADSTTTRRFGGTGLGLAICRKIAELMNGNLRCESQIDHGSKFILTIDLDEKARQDEDPNSKPENIKSKLFLDLENQRLQSAIARTFKHQVIEKESDLTRALSDEAEIVYLCDRKPKHSDSILTHKNLKIVLASNWHNRFESFGGKELQKIDSPFSAKELINILNQEKKKKQKEKSPLAATQKMFSKSCILLVEDNEINRKVVTDMLEILGIQVEHAEDGLRALEVYNRGKFDLVLMDCLMPRMDGFQALEAIRSTHPADTPIVALTANAMKEDREKCMSAGFDEYLSKPLVFNELIRVLKKFLASHGQGLSV